MPQLKNVVTVTRPSVTTKPCTDMAIGQIGIITDGYSDNNGAVILRTYSGFVSLTDPNSTWENAMKPSFKVDILPEGSTVTFTAGTSQNTTELEKRMLELLVGGYIINAIKEVRSTTGLDLKGAKTYVEQFRQKCWDNGSLPKVITNTPW